MQQISKNKEHIDGNLGREALLAASLWSGSLFKKNLWEDEGFDSDERKSWSESQLWRQGGGSLTLRGENLYRTFPITGQRNYVM